MEKNEDFLGFFRQISRIPHCTFETKKLRDFLLEFCDSCGFAREFDEAGNIHAFKGAPKVCLQAHYDMVCVGNAPEIEIIESDGFMSANNSSLGADNGIGIAICMAMMREFDDLEILFTNDEESGCMGASECKFAFKAPNLLNLDSETEDEVCIGCAGGLDLRLEKMLTKSLKMGNFYELKTAEFPGGHSGIEIAKNIPNAIKVMAKFVRENGGEVAEISGGERHNSIPVFARCVAVFKNEPEFPDFIKARNLGICEREILNESAQILDFLCAFHQGVYEYDESVKSPKNSANLSILTQEDEKIKIEIFPRAMSVEGLENLKFEIGALAQICGFAVKFENQSNPWEPKIDEFNSRVLEIVRKFHANAEFKAIHAGLECGIFLENNPNLRAASIGPNIFSPHTTHEKLDVNSAQKCLKIVREIIRSL